MKQELKRALQDAFCAPAPEKKQAFLNSVPCPKISYGQFLLTQAAYIRKWVWAVSAVIFLIALIYGQLLERNVLWVLSTIIPFLAISAIIESIRSEVYGMAELEMTSRFSLRSVVLARMGVLGVVHFGVLCLITIVGYRAGGANLFQTGVYLFVPYLLTDAVGLWLVRKVRGKEAVYASIGVAVIIGIVPAFIRYAMELLYEAEMFGWWLAALVILCGVTVSELKKSLRRMEELMWSLY